MSDHRTRWGHPAPRGPQAPAGPLNRTHDPDGDGVEGWFGTSPAAGNAGLTQLSKTGSVTPPPTLFLRAVATQN